MTTALARFLYQILEAMHEDVIQPLRDENKLLKEALSNNYGILANKKTRASKGKSNARKTSSIPNPEAARGGAGWVPPHVVKRRKP